MANLLDLARHSFAIHRRRRRGGADDDGSHLIDVHAHFLPDFYVTEMRRAGITDVDGWPLPGWSAGAAIDAMDRHGIAVQILSASSLGVTFARGRQAVELARAMNEYAAKLVQTHSPRFGGFAVLPLLHVEASLDEIHHSLDVLGLDGVGLPSNYDGIYLGDARFDPIFAELDRRAAVAFVHSTRPPNFAPMSMGLPTPIIEYAFDSTRMACELIRAGTMSRYHDLRLIVAHGGRMIPYLCPRLLARLGPDASRAFRSFYYDMTATTAPAQTTALLDVADVGHCLLGSDFPFTEPWTIAAVVAGLHLGNLSTTDLRSIRHGNATRLFPKVMTRLGLKGQERP